MPQLFLLVLAVHVGAGAVALLSFWGAVATRKGGRAHRLWGWLFSNAVYLAAVQALVMGGLSIVWPLAMHPELSDEPLYRGMFGWMMVYLGLLVISMTRYGLQMVANGRNHAGNRHWSMLVLQGVPLAAAAICVVQGLLLWRSHGPIMEPVLMVMVALLGFGTTLTYFRYLLKPQVEPRAYIPEHLKAMVACGIAAYTAFLSVGLIEMVPDHAFNPAIWAVPSVLGMIIIIHHLRALAPQRSSPRPAQLPAQLPAAPALQPQEPPPAGR